ncbi:hypothetical protein [Embleya sp. AB8]|uniref:hypothetical protein n=1 Tax=Embleya sp. AB8 TaxID=3156304 RepID=UPI003C786ABA
MNDKILLEETTETRDFADLDLDVRITDGEIEATNFGSGRCPTTSPNLTRSVQSRCGMCC